MGNRYTDLFRVIFMLNCFVLFLSFTGVTSAPVTPSIIDLMKNDSKICSKSKFLYDSKYTNLCASMTYPTAARTYTAETLNNFLCLGVYDTAYKICQYSSQLKLPLNSTAIFDSYVEKYVPNKNKVQTDFCNSLQGFTSLYDKIDSLWEQVVRNLNVPHTCIRICFDFQDQFHPLCAVFAWIKSIDDMMKSAKQVETKHDLTTTDKPHISQSKDGMTGDIETTPDGSKKIETTESKEQNRKQNIIDSNNNNVKEGNSNVPGNAPLANVKFGEEKTKSDTEKANNIQKKINTLETQTHRSVSSIFRGSKENIIGTEPGSNAEVAKLIKDISPNSDSQDPSINKAITNINKKVINEGNAQKSNKEQEMDDLKPSTLSENTQDHYDAVNPEENIENDIDGINTYKYALIMCVVVNVYKCVFVHV